MKDMIKTLQLLIAGAGGYLGWLLGGFDGFVYALVTFVAMDYVTGVMVAVLERRLSSEIGFKGIFKKVMIFTLVGIGNVIDTHLIKNGSAIRTAVIFFYLSNEGISIVENASKIGLPVPSQLRDLLEQLKGGGDKNGNE
jgi:toxin secretion/phage lysis holin